MKKYKNQFLVLLVLVGIFLIGFIFWQFLFNNGESNEQSARSSAGLQRSELLTVNNTIGDIIHHPAFADFGELLLPQSANINELLRFNQIASLMPYHSNISPENSVAALNRMIEDSQKGQTIFYPIYSEKEIVDDPTKAETGLFYFRGEGDAPFAVIAPGGGFSYVGSFHEGFPYAVELNEHGFNAFVIKYRTGNEQTATEDLAQAISLIQQNSEDLMVSNENYSLWGSSAGARMAARIGTDGVPAYGGADIEKPVTVVTAYTGHSMFSENDVPTFAVVSKDDPIASAEVMSQRIENLQQNSIPAEILLFENVGHGFGLGVETEAEGWIDEAVSFWQKQIK